jgi:hypothetical protein
MSKIIILLPILLLIILIANHIKNCNYITGIRCISSFIFIIFLSVIILLAIFWEFIKKLIIYIKKKYATKDAILLNNIEFATIVDDNIMI